MKRVGLIAALLSSCSPAFGGNRTCAPLVHNNYHVPHKQQAYQNYNGPGHYNAQYGAGEDLEATARLRRELLPLTEEIKGLKETINALRTEQKAGFSSLFKFKGQGQIIFEGGSDAGPVNPPVVPPANPPVVDPPAPSVDRGPPVTNYIRTMLTTSCSVCHDGNKQQAFDIDAAGTLDADRSTAIWGRLWSNKPGVMMPPQGSTEEQRNEANRWFLPSQVKGIESYIESQSKGK